jgi:hypothetical protein
VELGLAVRSLILVNHTFGNRFVELAAGNLQSLSCGFFVTGNYGLTSFAHVSLELRLYRFVAGASLLVSLNSLDLRLNICHVCFLAFFVSVSGQLTADRS